MFWWTDRYSPVSIPNYDQLGSPPYYIFLIIKQLTVFSVPAFLFVSGFFVAYAYRSKETSLNWGMEKKRIINLIIPYLIWSAVIFIGDSFQGIASLLGLASPPLARPRADAAVSG